MPETRKLQEMTPQQSESAENVLAASMMVQSLNCCLERKYLDSLTTPHALIKVVNNDVNKNIFTNIYWLKVTQVGKPINNGIASCFAYMQKILMSCALPDTQLTFLVLGDGKKCDLYLGLRDNSSKNQSMESTVSDLDNFAKVCWPGLKTEKIKEADDVINAHFNMTYNYVTAVTGIPSLAGPDGSGVTTIEHLIGGLHDQKFAYLVTANPVGSDRIDDILSQCRDIGGQLESIKKLNISKSVQQSSSKAYTVSHSQFHSWGHSDSVSQRDYKKGAGAALLGAGLTMCAGFFFPPALAVLPGIEGILAGSLSSSAPVATFLGLSGMSGMNVLSGFVPQNTRSEYHSDGQSDSKSKTESYSDSTSESVSKVLVNKHAEAALKELDSYVKRFELAKATGAWNVSCYLYTEKPSAASWQLKSILSGPESSLDPIRIHDVTNIISHKGTAKSSALMIRFTGNDGKEGPFFRHPFGEDFSQLTTLLTTRELSALVNFPLHSVPGINVTDSAPEFSLTPQEVDTSKPSLAIGKLLYGGTPSAIDVRLPLDTLSRHALVCGVNGSGKTNTVLGILEGFMKNARPFLVIEPAKTEYVNWAYKYNATVKDPKKKIKVFIPGCKRYVNSEGEYTPNVLRLNPFEVIKLEGSELRILSHIDRLKATFATAFPMQDILPVIMEHLLYFLYESKNNQLGSDDSLFLKKCGFPTLDDITRRFIDDLMTNLGYAKENTMNISAALRSRFDSLCYGWKNELLNNNELTGITWQELFGTQVVVNLSYAGDDQDRAFIMSLLLQFLYEYRIAESESKHFSFNTNKCRHLVVVEEAHRIMGQSLNPDSPQYKSGLMFSNFLSEVRAYGQGMMVVDQIPSRLIEDAIKNTNIKIIHKMVAADDIQQLGESIRLTPDQQKVISRLSVGQAILSGLNSADVLSSNSSDIYLAQIEKKK